MRRSARIATLNSDSAKRKRKLKKEEPKKPLSKRARFFATYNRQQNWPFRNSFINYITKNPSNPEVWQKLIQSCKHFFAKNPVLAIAELCYIGSGWYVSLNGVEKRYDFTKETLCKIWITDGLSSYRFFENLSTIISHFYRADINRLDLMDNVISYEEFLFLASNCEDISLDNTIVKNDDNSIVPLEKLVEVMPKIRKFVFADKRDSSSFTINTVKEIIQIPHFSKIDAFHLNDIPETFDIETFFTYIKKNKHTKIYLTFRDEISQAYKNRIEAVIDEIVAPEEHDYKVPDIFFIEIDNEKYTKLCHFLFHVN